jgi:hypothetical protein
MQLRDSKDQFFSCYEETESMYRTKLMNKPACEIIQEQMALYLTGELGDSEQQLFSAHISDCESCAQQQQKTLELLEKLQQYNSDIPGEKQWKAMTNTVYTQWQQENQTVRATGPISSVRELWSRVLAFEKNLPKIAFAGIVLVTVCVWLYYNTGPIPYTPNLVFHHAHFDLYVKEYRQNNQPGTGLAVNSTQLQTLNLYGFSGQIAPGAFALGAYYANSFQVCKYKSEKDCLQQLEYLDELINKYNAALQLPSLRDLENNDPEVAVKLLIDLELKLVEKLSRSDVELYLFQLGVWVNNISFAALNQVFNIQQEKRHLVDLINQAEEYQLAKGVLQSLNTIKNVLDSNELAPGDFSQLVQACEQLNEIMI